MAARSVNPILVTLGMLLLAVGLSAGWLASGLEQQVVTAPSCSTEKILTHKIAEGLSLQSGRLPGVELVRFESCRIEKQRMGGFSFGAFNMLVIDDLKIALPPDDPKEVLTDRPENQSEVAAVPTDGLPGKEFRNLLSAYPRFSALEINGLSVDEVVADGNQRKNILTASKVVAGRNSTLTLSDCGFLTDRGEKIKSGKATLSLKHPFLITTEQGTFRIEGFSDKHGLMFAQLTGK